jgi:ribosomal protein S14
MSRSHIVANRAPETAIVRCWSCGEVLGIWHDIGAANARFREVAANREFVPAG